MKTGEEEVISLDTHELVTSSWGEDPLMDDVKHEHDEDEKESAPPSLLQRQKVVRTLFLLVVAAMVGVLAWQLAAGGDKRSNGANAVEGTPQDLFQPTIAPSILLNSTANSPPSLFSARPSSYPSAAPSVAFPTSSGRFGDNLDAPSAIPSYAPSTGPPLVLPPFTRRPTRKPKSMSPNVSSYLAPISSTPIAPLSTSAPFGTIPSSSPVVPPLVTTSAPFGVIAALSNVPANPTTSQTTASPVADIFDPTTAWVPPDVVTNTTTTTTDDIVP